MTLKPSCRAMTRATLPLLFASAGLTLAGCDPDAPVFELEARHADHNAADPAEPRSFTASDLDGLRWQRRVFLVFAPDPSHPVLRRQAEFQWANDAARSDLFAGIADRRLLVAWVFADAGRGFNPHELQPAQAGTSDRPADLAADRLSIDAGSATGLRERFNIAPGEFTALLIGLDGGVKLRSKDPVPAQAVFDLIDSMPMRQSELRRRAD